MYKSVKLCAETIVVLGALACILVWLGIKPGDLRMSATWPHWAWLACGLLLFGISLWSSVRSWRLQRQGAREKEKELEGQVQNKQAEIEHLTESHAAEIGNKDSFVRDASKEALELRRKVAHDAPFTLSLLQQEAFQCAQELRAWIASIVSLATPPLIAGESEEQREQRIESARAAYRRRLRFQYESEYRNKVKAIYGKFAMQNI